MLCFSSLCCLCSWQRATCVVLKMHNCNWYFFFCFCRYPQFFGVLVFSLLFDCIACIQVSFRVNFACYIIAFFFIYLSPSIGHPCGDMYAQLSICFVYG
jgi:hypothetical protein